MAKKFTKSELKNKDCETLISENPTIDIAEIVTRKICNNVEEGQIFEKEDVKFQIYKAPEIVYTNNGSIGFQMYIKAWKNNNPIGFGEDGSVEIERIRVYCFSDYLVEDNTGNISKTFNINGGKYNGLKISKKYREGLLERFQNDIFHTISLVGKTGENIEKGKVGRTVDTFNPLRIASQRSGTGYFANNTGGGNFASWRGATSSGVISSAGSDPDFCYIQLEKTGSTAYGWNVRTWGNFDTSSIPDSNVISSAVLSIKPDGSIFGGPTDPLTGTKLGVTSFTPADPRNVTNSDFDNFADTRFATDINWSSLVSGTYADFTLNANGIANINKTGDSCFYWRTNWDIDNSAPSATSGNTGTGFAFGVSNPQKLVVTHASAGGATTNTGFMLGYLNQQ